MVHAWLRDHGVDDFSASALAIHEFTPHSIGYLGLGMTHETIPSYIEYLGRRDLPGHGDIDSAAERFQYPPMINNQPRTWTTCTEDNIAERRAIGQLPAKPDWPVAKRHRRGITPPANTTRSDPMFASGASYPAGTTNAASPKDDDAVSMGTPPPAA